MSETKASPLAAHESRWRLDGVRIERSRLSERALLHRSKAGPRLVFVHQTWFGARELAAVYFGLNTDDVTLVADERELWYERRLRTAGQYRGHLEVDGWRVHPYPGPWVGLSTAMDALFVRREGVDLIVSEAGFFDAENAPPEDEYAPRPTARGLRSKASKATKTKRPAPKKAKRR